MDAHIRTTHRLYLLTFTLPFAVYYAVTRRIPVTFRLDSYAALVTAAGCGYAVVYRTTTHVYHTFADLPRHRLHTLLYGCLPTRFTCRSAVLGSCTVTLLRWLVHLVCRGSYTPHYTLRLRLVHCWILRYAAFCLVTVTHGLRAAHARVYVYGYYRYATLGYTRWVCRLVVLVRLRYRGLLVGYGYSHIWFTLPLPLPRHTTHCVHTYPLRFPGLPACRYHGLRSRYRTLRYLPPAGSRLHLHTFRFYTRIPTFARVLWFTTVVLLPVTVHFTCLTYYTATTVTVDTRVYHTVRFVYGYALRFAGLRFTGCWLPHIWIHAHVYAIYRYVPWFTGYRTFTVVYAFGSGWFGLRLRYHAHGLRICGFRAFTFTAHLPHGSHHCVHGSRLFTTYYLVLPHRLRLVLQFLPFGLPHFTFTHCVAARFDAGYLVVHSHGYRTDSHTRTHTATRLLRFRFYLCHYTPVPLPAVTAVPGYTTVAVLCTPPHPRRYLPHILHRSRTPATAPRRVYRTAVAVVCAVTLHYTARSALHLPSAAPRLRLVYTLPYVRLVYRVRLYVALHGFTTYTALPAVTADCRSRLTPYTHVLRLRTVVRFTTTRSRLIPCHTGSRCYTFYGLHAYVCHVRWFVVRVLRWFTVAVSSVYALRVLLRYVLTRYRTARHAVVATVAVLGYRGSVTRFGCRMLLRFTFTVPAHGLRYAHHYVCAWLLRVHRCGYGSSFAVRVLTVTCDAFTTFLRVFSSVHTTVVTRLPFVGCCGLHHHRLPHGYHSSHHAFTPHIRHTHTYTLDYRSRGTDCGC